MLQDVLSAVRDSNHIHDCVVVSPDHQILKIARISGSQTLKEVREMGVNDAVSKASEYSVKHGSTCTVVFPADIPLLSPLDIHEIIQAGLLPNSVVLTPSAGLNGTNALLCNPPDLIPTFYDIDSFNSHLIEARKSKLRVKILLSRRVMLDIDTPGDIDDFLSTESDTLTYRFLHQLAASKLAPRHMLEFWSGLEKSFLESLVLVQNCLRHTL